MRREAKRMVMRATLIGCRKMMHHHVKRTQFARKVKQVFGKLWAHFLFSVFHAF